MSGHRMPSLAELYEPAMLVQTQEAADACLDRLATLHVVRNPGTHQLAAYEAERANVGLWAATKDEATRERVARLFGTVVERPLDLAAAFRERRTKR